MKRLIFCVTILLIYLIPSTSFAGEIYIIRLNNGKSMKCLSIDRGQDTISCDADGLNLSVPMNDITRIEKSEGLLTKFSPNSRTLAGATLSQRPNVSNLQKNMSNFVLKDCTNIRDPNVKRDCYVQQKLEIKAREAGVEIKDCTNIRDPNAKRDCYVQQEFEIKAKQSEKRMQRISTGDQSYANCVSGCSDELDECKGSCSFSDELFDCRRRCEQAQERCYKRCN